MNSGNRRFYLLVVAIMPLCAVSAFADAPTISVFAPASGALNATVTITGTNFVAPLAVSFNGVNSASVTLVSSTSVKATVPYGATTGVISLVTSGGSAMSASAFTIVPGLSVSATVGPPTAAVTLYYSGYGAGEPVDVYFDAADIALGAASAVGAGNMSITIPATARPGSHWITAVGRRSIDAVQIPFTVRTNWPQYGFQPNLKAKNHYENVLSSANVIDLDEAWRTPFIGEVDSTPAIVNGIVYGTFKDGSIRAFDEITGAQKWSFATGGSFMVSSPAVSNGIVYAGSSDNCLYALDAVTGALKWRYVTGNLINSSPNVVNGIVYFGSNDDNVYALNAMTGVSVWSFTTKGSVNSSPAVANGVLYVGSEDENVYALNATTGALIWQFDAAALVSGSPVLVGGFVCIGTSTGLMYALRASTGAVAWSYTVFNKSSISGSAAVVGGALFFGAGSEIFCLSSGGAPHWEDSLPAGGVIGSPLCVANGVVYVRDNTDTYAFDQNTGQLLTTLPIGSIDGGVAVVNGAVFGGDLTDGVLARYTPNALLSNYVAPRPDPMQLRPHPLR